MANPKMGRSRLPEHLKRAGLTQADFARRLDVSESYVSRVIAGKKKLSYERAKMAANILHCSMEDLYEWD